MKKHWLGVVEIKNAFIEIKTQIDASNHPSPQNKSKTEKVWKRIDQSVDWISPANRYFKVLKRWGCKRKGIWGSTNTIFKEQKCRWVSGLRVKQRLAGAGTFLGRRRGPCRWGGHLIWVLYLSYLSLYLPLNCKFLFPVYRYFPRGLLQLLECDSC